MLLCNLKLWGRKYPFVLRTRPYTVECDLCILHMTYFPELGCIVQISEVDKNKFNCKTQIKRGAHTKSFHIIYIKYVYRMSAIKVLYSTILFRILVYVCGIKEPTHETVYNNCI